MKTAPFPKAASASLIALSMCPSSDSMFSTILIPRPPPPKAALINTGKPLFLQNSVASLAEDTGPGVPGTMGTLAASAIVRAAVLSPRSRMTSARGPTKIIPAASRARTNCSFSERKP
eukprot:Lithocolla_globosa_v1_NODE_407_length_4133_cov_91.104463.p6 type:complete len:118 gc:universal NODE_407_length_4133_cov_91.104463:3346-3699(+)